MCKTLWEQDQIKSVYADRANMGIEASTKHFWDGIDNINTPDYVPSSDDILLCRYRTTGVIDQTFKFKQQTFHIFDVGGQKSERRRWYVLWLSSD